MLAFERVLRIRARRPDGKLSVGSATLMSRRLALTAAHVVADPETRTHYGDIEIAMYGGSDFYQGTAVWLGRDNMDAALIDISDPRWTPPLDSLVRLGRTTGRTAGVPIESMGFPRVLRTSDHTRDTAHLEGTLNPGAGLVSQRYGMNLTSAKPNRGDDPDDPSPWAGLSGAGLASGKLLIGVIIRETNGFGEDYLTAIPINALMADAEFRRLLDAADFPLVLESVELNHLIHFARPTASRQMPYRSPAALLRPEAQIVKFFGRATVMTQLCDWCADKHHLVDIVLITGPGGQGKTRLAQELVTYHEQRGWITGFLRPDSVGEAYSEYDLTPIADTVSEVPGILLVVDYAETRFNQLSRLLTLFAGSVDLPSVRLLLLARSSGEWWNELRRRHPNVLEHAVQVPLGGLSPSSIERTMSFKTAVLSYVAEGALPSVYPDHDWRTIAEDITPPNELDDPAYGSSYSSPLTLQLSALTSLLERAQIISHNAFDSPEERLLAHEQCYWSDTADAAGLPFNAPYQRRLLSYFVAAASLFGASNEAEAIYLITRLPAWNSNYETVRGVVEWLHRLYPPDDDQRYWGSLQPDRLAEYHLRSLAQQQHDLLQLFFKGATIEEADHATPLLVRAAKLHDELTKQLDHLLSIEDLPCRARLIFVVQEITVPLQRPEANLDLSRQHTSYVMTPTSDDVSGSSPGGIIETLL